MVARAWEAAQQLPIEVFKTQPHLKITGIAICLADVLENNNQPERAYDLYTEALLPVQEADSKGRLTGPEKMRAVALAYKLGEMAHDFHRPPDEEEKWLVEAVEMVLKIISHPSPNANDGQAHMEVGDRDSEVINAELELPPWATRTDLAAPFEALGTVYAQAEKVE